MGVTSAAASSAEVEAAPRRTTPALFLGRGKTSLLGRAVRDDHTDDARRDRDAERTSATGRQRGRSDFQECCNARGKRISAQSDAWTAPEATDFEKGPNPPPSFEVRSTGQDGEGVPPQISGDWFCKHGIPSSGESQLTRLSVHRP